MDNSKSRRERTGGARGDRSRSASGSERASGGHRITRQGDSADRYRSSAGRYGTQASDARGSRGARDPRLGGGNASSGARGARSAPSSSRMASGRPRGAAPNGDAPYSRNATSAAYLGQRKRKSRRKRLKIALVSVLAVLLLGAGAAWAYIDNISKSLNNGIDSSLSSVLVSSDITKEPFYVLLLGTDESVSRDADDSTGGTYRTDTIILARIDPTSKKITLVSIPRDTEVNLGSYGNQKVNAAYAYGGATLAVQAVSQLCGVSISHFALIDFDGFSSVVDALGGIDVDVPMAISDDDADCYLSAGQQTLNGAQALGLCRARHAYDDYGSGDLYRAANQRLVLGAIGKKLLSSDIITITNSVNAMAKDITTDMSLTDIVALAQALQGFDSSTSLYSATMPTTASYTDDIWYQVVDTSAWNTMMKRVEQGLPPTSSDEVDSATGTVLATTGSSSSSDSGTHSGTVYVRNGSGATGIASSASTAIQSMGFTVETGNADSFNYANTLVIYDSSSGNSTEAQQIASKLGVGSVTANDGTYSMGSSKYLVVLGADYKSS